VADVCVIGAGPAGVAAALELARRGAPLRLFERGTVGGCLRCASLVRNYPGFPGGTGGGELAALMREQLAREGIEAEAGAAVILGRSAGGLDVAGPGGVRAFRCVVAATGTTPLRAGFEGEEELAREGRLLYEATADAARAAGGRRAVVIGGGDVAFDYAATLARAGARVTLLCRSVPRAIPFLRAQAAGLGVEVVEGDAPVRGSAAGGEAASLRTSGGRLLEVELLLVAVGRTADVGALDTLGRVDVSPDGRTTVPGLFVAGDVLHPGLRQAAVAVGDGTRAATFAADLLASP